jgi:hypothetical protein
MDQRTRRQPGPFGASRRRLGAIGILLAASGPGCGIAPRNFRSLTHPAPIVRARSVAFGQGLPESKVVPALIERLDDPDPVVRLSAHEELRKQTGQDFGYVPWAPPAERAHAVDHWRGWWERRKAGLAGSRPSP